MPLKPSTKTWLLVTAPASAPLLYVLWVTYLDSADHAQIIKVVEIEKLASIRRPYMKQLLTKDIKFPLPHRSVKPSGKKLFAYSRPTTFA